MSISAESRKRLFQRLQKLYGDKAENCLDELCSRCERFESQVSKNSDAKWSERDVVLITYGDQISDDSSPPLSCLQRFLEQHRVAQAINTVHILPFFPYSSDDGFSVIDYRVVDPDLGTWKEVSELGQSFDLMFDLVLNHCSQHHEWFQQFRESRDPYHGYFHAVDPSVDLSAVTRPRSSPVLTPYETKQGTAHVWTTFSDDQVDLNFSNPDVLLEMLDILLFYVQQGARVIRLDAIAYLWKRPGTSCIHLSETHEVVKLMRDVLDVIAPATILLTETNVPHDENVSYFGDGDEAHMVYQFSLSPLLLDAFLNGNAEPLMEWLNSLGTMQSGTTYFNFTASHDGVGVRPLEGLVSSERFERLVEHVRAQGGKVSTRRRPDGSDSPYELNVSYFSALGKDDSLSSDGHVRRFLSSQAIMLGLRGIPGVYFHSLVGTPNYAAGVEETGRARTINRRKYVFSELEDILSDSASTQATVFNNYCQMLKTRISQPAFHPDAPQRVVDFGYDAVVGFERQALDGNQRVVVACNVSSSPVELDLAKINGGKYRCDLLTDTQLSSTSCTLAPFQAVWLSSVS